MEKVETYLFLSLIQWKKSKKGQKIAQKNFNGKIKKGFVIFVGNFPKKKFRKKISEKIESKQISENLIFG